VGELPQYLQTIEHQVEEVRGLRFISPVGAEPVTKAEMADTIRSLTEDGIPRDLLARRGTAWRTIGVLPQGTDLAQAIIDLNASQVIGFYEPGTRRLVFVGSADPSPLDRYVLAHELTHALDDQHFDLTLLDRLSAACHDEQADAYQALAEGDATATSNAWAQKYLSIADQVRLGIESGVGAAQAGTSNAPQFLADLSIFPYVGGEAFVQELEGRGGEGAVDAAFRSPPVSTEQILDPSHYPADLPHEGVTMPELGGTLGAAWHPLDGMDVGQEFLRAMLALSELDAQAAADTAGWGGGAYRAWTDGTKVAVVMETEWDATVDAARFVSALRRLGAGGMTNISQSALDVQLLFATDVPTLLRLADAVPPLAG
jgi:hypothetical protein